MRKYPLGFALIEWKEGGHSEAVIFQDAVGNQCIQCANWLATPNQIPYLSNFIDEISNIVTDVEDIAMIKQWDE